MSDVMFQVSLAIDNFVNLNMYIYVYMYFQIVIFFFSTIIKSFTFHYRRELKMCRGGVGRGLDPGIVPVTPIVLCTYQWPILASGHHKFKSKLMF